VAIKLHIVEMPERANWLSFASVAMLCGIGFTVSMFMAGLSFPVDLEGQDPALMQALLNDAKLGILCGTVLSALVGCLMLHFTLPKHSEA
jgi:NhaA family Na+:H+ antiporter